jgi:catalase-peroxidase
MKYWWKLTTDSKDTFEGRDRKTGAVKWRAIRADLIFGTNFACTDSHEEFVKILR